MSAAKYLNKLILLTQPMKSNRNDCGTHHAIIFMKDITKLISIILMNTTCRIKLEIGGNNDILFKIREHGINFSMIRILRKENN